MAQVLYANNVTLYQALQTLIPKRFGEDPIFKILPVMSQREQEVAVDSRFSYFGATQGRQQGAGFGTVAREEKGRAAVPTFPYGEDKPMNEEFMMKSREIGTFGTAINIKKEQGKDMENLTDRIISRFQEDFWNLMTTGTYSVADQNGTIIGSDSYAFGQFTVATPWSNLSAATPLADLRRLKLNHRGQSVMFDQRATIFMQSQDVNNLLNNTNPNDIGARLKFIPGYGTRTLNLGDINSIFLSMGLAQIVEYDEFIATSAASFATGPASYNMLIPYQTAICFGYRKYGEPLGYQVLTPTWGHVFLSDRDSSVPDSTTMSDRELSKNPWANIYFDFKMDRENWRARSRVAAQKGIRIDFPSAIYQMNLN
jgi:hypothetical protein